MNYSWPVNATRYLSLNSFQERNRLIITPDKGTSLPQLLLGSHDAMRPESNS